MIGFMKITGKKFVAFKEKTQNVYRIDFSEQYVDVEIQFKNKFNKIVKQQIKKISQLLNNKI